MYVCMYVCMYVYMYVCIYVCMYVCMYATSHYKTMTCAKAQKKQTYATNAHHSSSSWAVAKWAMLLLCLHAIPSEPLRYFATFSKLISSMTTK